MQPLDRLDAPIRIDVDALTALVAGLIEPVGQSPCE
jgi:hypothetical protein